MSDEEMTSEQPQVPTVHAHAHARIVEPSALAIPAKGTRAGRAARIDHIVALMSHIPSRWTPEAREQTALLFDVALTTLESDASEATRRIESATTDEQLRVQLERALEATVGRLKDIADRDDVKPGTEILAWRELRETVVAWANLRGVAAPVKHDVGDTLAAILRLAKDSPE